MALALYLVHRTGLSTVEPEQLLVKAGPDVEELVVGRLWEPVVPDAHAALVDERHPAAGMVQGAAEVERRRREVAPASSLGSGPPSRAAGRPRRSGVAAGRRTP